MRKVIVIAFMLFSLVSLAAAQIPTSGNVFLGYSYYSTEISTSNRNNTNGWEASLEGKALPFLGFVADFDGHYGAQTYQCSLCVGSVNFSENNVMFGPRVSASVGKTRPFVEGLIGIGHGSISGGQSGNSLASAIGGGFDYKIVPLIAWRFQGDYIHAHLYGIAQNNVRISTGIVFRF